MIIKYPCAILQALGLSKHQASLRVHSVKPTLPLGYIVVKHICLQRLLGRFSYDGLECACACRYSVRLHSLHVHAGIVCTSTVCMSQCVPYIYLRQSQHDKTSVSLKGVFKPMVCD